MDYIPNYQEYVIKYELQTVWYQWIQQTSLHLNDFLQILKLFYWKSSDETRMGYNSAWKMSVFFFFFYFALYLICNNYFQLYPGKGVPWILSSLTFIKCCFFSLHQLFKLAISFFLSSFFFFFFFFTYFKLMTAAPAGNLKYSV